MSDSDIITLCPQCNTAFRVTANQLAVADGVVRCGSCLTVFKAINYKSKIENPRIESNITHALDANELNLDPQKTQKNKHISTIQPRRPETVSQRPRRKSFDELINDGDDELDPSYDSNIFSFDADNNTEKTTLFDRKLKPAKEKKLENTDESWALNMLSELEDEQDKTDQDLGPFESHQKPINSPTKKPLPRQKSRGETIKPKKKSIFSFTDKQTEECPSYLPPFSGQNEAIRAKPSNNERMSSSQAPQANQTNDDNDYLSNIEPAPVEMDWLESRNTRQRLWIIGIFLTTLLLIAQISVFQFEHLSKLSSYRPFYRIACNILGCQLPSLNDINKIRTVNLLIRSHPSQTQALIADVILINNANYEQPFPGLHLEFSDLNSKAVASRIIQPKEYLRGELAGAKSMPSNQPIQISLEFFDPGASAVNYELNVVHATNYR